MRRRRFVGGAALAAVGTAAGVAREAGGATPTPETSDAPARDVEAGAAPPAPRDRTPRSG